MAGIQVPKSDRSSLTDVRGDTGYRFPLVALTVLFFMRGFITCLNDILIPHLKAVFDLSYTQAMLIQFCFFGAYFAVSLPAGTLVRRIGYQKGIVCGLIIAGAGCALFYPAAETHAYPLFLAALFILASGITLLQVSANPYVTALGSPQTASSRLTLTQAFNSLGTTVAPFFGGALILSAAAVGAESMSPESQAATVKVPYLILAAALLLLAVFFSQLKLPVIESHRDTNARQERLPSLWSHAHLVLGAMGIFLYVGAEVAIGSFLVNFLGEAHIAGFPEAQAAHYVAYYWGGAMVGRFVGAVVMHYLRPGMILGFNATAAVLLVVTAILSEGGVAMWAILLVGLCNSIMFPTIFSLALTNLGKQTSQASGLLCLAIVGGALVPLLQGALADTFGLQNSFWIPAVCYLYIAYYGLRGSRVQSR